MPRILARVEREEDCPLYGPGEGMEFTFPMVTGLEYAPICFKAVVTFSGSVALLNRGHDPSTYRAVFCGGCTGKAWFGFSVEPDAGRLAPDAARAALEALGRVKLFSGLRPTLLERILPLLRERACEPGELIIRQGQVGRALSLILGGAFEVVRAGDGEEEVLATLHAGECFGEMALVTGEPTSATVVCKEAGTVLEIRREDFPRLAGRVPALGLTLARILAARVTQTSSWVVEQIRRGLIGRLEMIPPADLIQAMHVSNQSGTVQATSQGRAFSLAMQDGQPVGASLGDLTGEEAVFAFLEWEDGTFRFEPGPPKLPRTIRLDSMGLLLEGMRRRDEATTLRRTVQDGDLPADPGPDAVS